MTDAGLKELAALKSLQRLDLISAQAVSGTGLKELAGLKSLRPRWTSAGRRCRTMGLRLWPC